ncbi:XRE family transcriptional regulator [Streptomyces natalensis]|uniref:XRE family transcriptional regulator n=1 Tax=Streptomyces natalensis TaxID=68242 RepID=UPI000AC76A18|nr:XRE family transcriptional regulator [Streptomyces natalensis]
MEAAAADRQHHPEGSAVPDSLAEQLDRDELSRLVREANDAGASYQQLADRAVDPETGEQLSKPYMQKLATNAVTTAPNAARLRAIAAALRQPLTVVQRAAARQFLDYKATELSGYDDDVRVIVAHLAGMTPTAKRRWRAMIEAVENVDEE